jgi:radical SAM superfamily enzyme YgiQ (UPF0313 family)
MSKKTSLSSYLYKIADDKTDKMLMNKIREQDRHPDATDHRLPTFTLLVGPSPFTMPRGWEYYLTAPFEGVSYIATVSANAGFPTRIVDVRFEPDPLNAAFQKIMEDTDVLGIAAFEDNFPFVSELIEKVKKKRPDMPVICGGSLATSVPYLFMSHTKTDIAVISEGELTILELLESYSKDRIERDLPNIHGIWYRAKNGEIINITPRGQALDLDFLPKMRLDLWHQSREEKGLQPQVITSYSRGCKMDCSFCFRTTPQVSSKSQKKFSEDIAWLVDQYAVNFLFFTDLTFNADTRQVKEMCEVLEGHNLRWTCMCRCADADKERLDAIAKAGCDIILYGVESLGAAALKEVRKPTTENISIRAMHRTFDAGIRFGALLIVGLPGETEEDLDHMAKWAETYNHVTRVKYLQALPGTPIYYDFLKKGILKNEIDHLNWLSIEQALYEDEFLNVNGLPEEAMRRAYKRMYDAYQPGPVMSFHHWPDHFSYFDPNPNDGKARSTDYAGKNWRSEFASAGPSLIPGSERFTLDKTGTKEMVQQGAQLVKCGAKEMIGGQHAE